MPIRSYKVGEGAREEIRSPDISTIVPGECWKVSEEGRATGSLVTNVRVVQRVMGGPRAGESIDNSE
jgi:hypothetical protein